MQLEIYRAVAPAVYPEEMLVYHYSFQPIPSVEHERDGHLMDWTDDSGPEPDALSRSPMAHKSSRVRMAGSC